nr:MAG TPA: hypothetical protein [Bacteriophage sp.]
MKVRRIFYFCAILNVLHNGIVFIKILRVSDYPQDLLYLRKR